LGNSNTNKIDGNQKSHEKAALILAAAFTGCLQRDLPGTEPHTAYIRRRCSVRVWLAILSVIDSMTMSAPVPE